ncbi:hypothetical protein V3481_000621 [Fusarium oxysporum f. sp. vasinfectum]
MKKQYTQNIQRWMSKYGLQAVQLSRCCPILIFCGSNVDLWRLTSVTQLQESLGRKLSLRVDAQQGIPSSMTLGTTEPHCSFSAPMASIRNRYQYLDHTTSVFNGVADVQLKGRHVKAKPFQSTKALRHSCMEAKSNTFLVRTR